MGFEFGGILGLVILIADIWALVKTFQSPVSAVLGLIIWLLAGPDSRKR